MYHRGSGDSSQLVWVKVDKQNKTISAIMKTVMITVKELQNSVSTPELSAAGSN